jgi:hypothetical protein
MTETTQTQVEYTALQLVKVLAGRGYPASYRTIIDDLIPMLRDLGLVRVVDVSTGRGQQKSIRNMVSASTVDALADYLKARQEQGMTRYPHGAHTWKMLVNLGYMPKRGERR